MILLLLLQAVTYGAATHAFVMAFLGFAGTIIVQGIKRYAGASNQKALIITVITCLILATGGAWITGELTAYGIVTGWSIVFSTATIAYKFLIDETNKLIGD